MAAIGRIEASPRSWLQHQPGRARTGWRNARRRQCRAPRNPLPESADRIRSRSPSAAARARHLSAGGKGAGVASPPAFECLNPCKPCPTTLRMLVPSLCDTGIQVRGVRPTAARGPTTCRRSPDRGRFRRRIAKTQRKPREMVCAACVSRWHNRDRCVIYGFRRDALPNWLACRASSSC
jgi:hypothetical protein